MENKFIKNKKAILGVSTIIFILGALFFVVTDSRLKIVRYDIKSEKIERPFKVAHITDLHNCYYGDGQKDLIEALDAENPDLVVFTGDIFEEDLPHINSKTFISGIKDKYDLYYVTGNHEFYKGDIDEVFDFLAENNVNVLHGDRKEVEINGNKIVINGIDDECIDWINGGGAFDKQLNYLNSTTDKSKFNIFLSHRPYLVETYTKGGYDLILCGHSHGGQVRIPFLLNGIVDPDQGLFPKYVGGRYEVEGSTMIISRGLARESTRVPRVFNRPELVILNIK